MPRAAKPSTSNEGNLYLRFFICRPFYLLHADSALIQIGSLDSCVVIFIRRPVYSFSRGGPACEIVS